MPNRGKDANRRSKQQLRGAFNIRPLNRYVLHKRLCGKKRKQWLEVDADSTAGGTWKKQDDARVQGQGGITRVQLLLYWQANSQMDEVTAQAPGTA